MDDVRDGVAAAERREQRRRKRMPVHGRGLEAVLNAIQKRARNAELAAKDRTADPRSTPAERRRRLPFPPAS